MSDFQEYLAEQLQDDEFKKEYDALEPEFAIIQALIDARKNCGITQKELSQRTGITQADISKLEKCRKTLRALRIKNCPRISDFSVLSQLENLEHLILEGKNKLPSLSFIKELPNLKTLIFDMEIEDGDLQPCMDLSYVYCCRVRRHYNLKEKDLPKGTYYWGNDNIEPWRRVR